MEFDLQYRLPYEMEGVLSRHEVDMAFSNEPFRRAQIANQAIFQEKIICLGPKPSKRLSWEELPRLSWISYGEEDPPWLEFERQAAKHGVRLPKPVLRVADVESVLSLVEEGAGYAFAPEHSLQFRSFNKSAVQQLPTGAMERSIYLYRLKTVALSPAAEEFQKLFKDKVLTKKILP